MEPSQPSSNAIPIAIVAGFGLIALAVFFSGIGKSNDAIPAAVQQKTAEAPKAKSNIRPVDETDYIRGNPNAPIVIVEYSDYDCPFCKNFHETMNQIMNEYGVNGKVAWVYRQFPIAQLHPNAPRISKAALCVGELGGNDAFWKFSDKIFLDRNVNEPTNVSKLVDYAVEAGVDSSEYISCMESDRHEKTVTDSLADGANAGIEGTPNSFIIVGNQQAPIEGAQPYPVVKQLVQSLVDQLDGKDPTQSAVNTGETNVDANANANPTPNN